MRNQIVPLSALFTLGAAACGDNSPPQAKLPAPVTPIASETSKSATSSPKVRASTQIEDSFRQATGSGKALLAAKTPEAGDESQTTGIVLTKQALEKEFLLQAALIPQAEAALGNGQRSRIVAFRKSGSSIFMMEATDGHSITDALPQNLVLAEFPVVEEDELGYTIDFAEGMSRILLATDWTGSDEGASYSGDWESVEVRASFLAQAEAVDEQTFVIRQIAQLDELVQSQGELIRKNPTVEIKYYLQPYTPNPDFEPTIGGDFQQFGYFEVAPRLGENSKLTVLASKFDVNQPIEFAISANTPSEFKEAVKDGILYWNKAFGKDIIKVVDAPNGVAAPDFNHNVVQWVANDEAGFAYADAQMDPRTGEILHAQVYMTSVFAAIGKQRAQRLLANLRTPQRVSQFALKGFAPSLSCQRALSSEWSKALTVMLQEGVSDERILKASQDYVAEVMAHEIGHTLGFRHNFAGSLGANIAPQDRSQALDVYFERGQTPSLSEVTPKACQNQECKDLLSSSSVMEYSGFEESILMGDGMRKDRNTGPLPYDKMAVRSLYFGDEFPLNETPVFCTDSLNGKTLDCATFDVGRNAGEIVEWRLETRDTAIRSRIYQALVDAVEAKQDDPSVNVAEALLGLNIDALASEWVNAQSMMTRALSSEAKLVSVRRRFNTISQVTEARVVSSERKTLQSHLKSDLWSSYSDSIRLEEVQILLQGLLPSLESIEGLTLAEKEAIKTLLGDVALVLHKAAVIADINSSVPSDSTFRDAFFEQDIQSSLEEKAKAYILSQTHEHVIELDEETSVSLPVYEVSHETRLLATKLLEKKWGEKPDFSSWNLKARQDLRDELNASLEVWKGALGERPVHSWPREVRETVLTTETLICRLESDFPDSVCKLN